MASQRSTFRFDIQVLRGLAVLLVVLYHADLLPIPGGYLGVDFFFVISGYLITKMVAEGIRNNTFSLSQFYFRRARRLLPAAYSTFLACALLAPWVLNQQELRDFASQMVGALTFTGNFVLWQQTGYFEGSGDLKPLLHMWSLSLEEQYYFLLPSLLLLLPQKRWRLGCAVLLLASGAMCVAGLFVKPVATFYLLPTRAWELLVGSFGAMQLQCGLPPLAGRILARLFAPSLLALLLLPVFPLPGPHPGWNSLLVCVATIVVITARKQWPERNRLLRAMKGFGDISYSLYLVHWPVIAFLHNAWVGSKDYPYWVKAGAVLLSFALALLQYRYVENPLRHAGGTPLRAFRQFATLALAFGLVTPAALLAQSARPDFTRLLQPNYGLSIKCNYKEGDFTPQPECQSSPAPTLLLWGDSFAMHLATGLAKQWQGKGGIEQATQSLCAPFLGIAAYQPNPPVGATLRPLASAERCIAFNESVFDYLARNPSIKSVVISSTLMQFYEANAATLAIEDGRAKTGAPDPSQVTRHVVATIRRIQALGKKVALVAPPPSSGFNIGGCLEKQVSATFAVGGADGCLVSVDRYRSHRAGPLAMLAELENKHGISVLRMDHLLCNQGTCRTMIDNVILYRDEGHLSFAGSEWIAEHMDWRYLAAE